MSEYKDNNQINDNQSVNQNVYSTEFNYQPKKTKLKLALIIVGSLVLVGLIIYIIFFSGIFSKKDIIQEKIDDIQKMDSMEEKNNVFSKIRQDDDDLDNDGLTNEEEDRLGTSNSEFDTDRDGIPDSLEVKKYGTDPLKFDTDGDSFSDSFEIINGYNPLGEGRL